jgi:hypothetical protein
MRPARILQGLQIDCMDDAVSKPPGYPGTITEAQSAALADGAT